MKYVRRNFLCGLQGREPASLEELNGQLRRSVWVDGTTHEEVMVRWDADQMALRPAEWAARPTPT